MKEYRHVFSMGAGYVFRLRLPGCNFVSSEVQTSAEDAGFYADVFKRHLSTTYCLPSATLLRSLSPSRFNEMLAEAGGPDALPHLLPASCREYLEFGGHERLTAMVSARDELRKATW